MNASACKVRYIVISSGLGLLFRRNRSCRASDSACSFTFLRSVVCLSVGRLSHSCTRLNRSTDLDAIWQVHLWVQRHIMLDGVPDPQEGPTRGRGRGDLGVEPSAKTCNSQTVSPTVPPGEYKRRVGWTCHSVSAFCQIILVFVTTILNHCLYVVGYASLSYNLTSRHSTTFTVTSLWHKQDNYFTC